jgi:hypothetical protein
MSKSNAAQRRLEQKKLPLAMQKLLANGYSGKAQAAADNEFYLNYLENRRQAALEQKPFREALNALHETNPFKEVEYGAAIFTYVSTELSIKIGELCAEWKVAVQENLQGKSWSSVRYPWNDGKPVSQEYVMPSPDHADFMKFVTYEQLRATPEQDLNMRALLTQMAKDLGIADEAQNV